MTECTICGREYASPRDAELCRGMDAYDDDLRDALIVRAID